MGMTFLIFRTPLRGRRGRFEDQVFGAPTPSCLKTCICVAGGSEMDGRAFVKCLKDSGPWAQGQGQGVESSFKA